MAQVKAGMDAFSEQISRAKGQLLAFVSISWAAGKAQEIIQIADAWNSMTARLKLATAGQQEFTRAQQALFAIAQRVGVPIAETTQFAISEITDLIDDEQLRVGVEPDSTGNPPST